MTSGVDLRTNEKGKQALVLFRAPARKNTRQFEFKLQQRVTQVNEVTIILQSNSLVTHVSAYCEGRQKNSLTPYFIGVAG